MSIGFKKNNQITDLRLNRCCCFLMEMPVWGIQALYLGYAPWIT